MVKRLLKEGGSTPPYSVDTGTLLNRSECLAKLVAMRAELESLWARSTATHEQLVQQLQDWICHAEQSGIRQLEEFSLRLRAARC